MRFADLEPRFYTSHPKRGGVTFGEAQGVLFLCPTCFMSNHGPVGTHSILIWSRGRGTPEDVTPRGRWALEGTGIDDFTLGGEPGPDNPEGKRSVVLPGDGCRAHFSITNGIVTFHEDNGAR